MKWSSEVDTLIRCRGRGPGRRPGGQAGRKETRKEEEAAERHGQARAGPSRGGGTAKSAGTRRPQRRGAKQRKGGTGTPKSTRSESNARKVRAARPSTEAPREEKPSKAQAGQASRNTRSRHSSPIVTRPAADNLPGGAPPYLSGDTAVHVLEHSTRASYTAPSRNSSGERAKDG